MSQTAQAALSNTRIQSKHVLPTPHELRERIPVSADSQANIHRARQQIADIIDGRDHRLLIVVGPCSIHNIDSAQEYARRLKDLADELADELLIAMRVYFEKPRTTVGWKGFVNDPYLDDSFAIEEGLVKARELLVWIDELGLPTATEALDPISPQYLGDLFSWSAIGARTTESQTHREMASGLSTPVGFKNGTTGGLDVAINAMQSASSSHQFLGIDSNGQVAVMETAGNPSTHVILRGGKEPNYDSVAIAVAEKELRAANLRPAIMVDCSHANSHKNFELQPLVADNVVNQIIEGNRSIMGLMLESHLNAGNQKLGADPAALRYGVSITDACIGWGATEELLRDIASRLSGPLRQRIAAD